MLHGMGMLIKSDKVIPRGFGSQTMQLLERWHMTAFMSGGNQFKQRIEAILKHGCARRQQRSGGVTRGACIQECLQHVRGR